ncbi:MAG: hypothetical protein PPP55_00205 [Halorubrum sp.]
MITLETLSSITQPWLLLILVFGYAIVVAAVFPLPTEAVLAVPLLLPYPWYVSVPLVVLVAAAGKAVGSLVALRVGKGVSRSGPVVRLYERVPRYEQFKREWLAEFVKRYQYVGLGVAIAIPFLPETTTLYAFSVLDGRPVLFATTAFVATILRLLIVVAVAGGVVTLVG